VMTRRAVGLSAAPASLMSLDVARRHERIQPT
jgi:hypothetical protein